MAGPALGQEGWGISSQPEVAALSAVLMNPATGEVLFAKEPHLRLPPASTTKVLTALVALEHLDLNDRVPVSPQAASAPPSRIGLRAGEAALTQDLLYGLMLKSGNDAAETLAEAAGGSIYGFAELMNAKASQIGARDSHFMNPHGLPNDDHYSTAYDLALIFRQAMNNPLFADIVRTRNAALRIETSQGPYGDWRMVPVVNHNRLLGSYEGTLGGKTGFTRKARRCFVGEVDRDGVRLIVAILNSPTSGTLWRDARALLDYGFIHYGVASPPSVPLEPLPVLVRREPVVSPNEEESDEPAPIPSGRRIASVVASPNEEESGESAPIPSGRRIASAVVSPSEEKSDEPVARPAPVTHVAMVRPTPPVEAELPALELQGEPEPEAEAVESEIAAKPVVAAHAQRIIRTRPMAEPVAAPVVGKSMVAGRPVATPVVGKPVVGKPVVGKPMVAGRPVATPVVGKPVVGKPVVGRPMVAGRPVATPVVGKPMVAGRPVARPVVGKPMVVGRPVARPVVGKPMVAAKPSKPLMVAMATVKPTGIPDKAAKPIMASSGKAASLKPAPVAPARLEKREAVKVAVRAEPAAKSQKARR